MTVYVKNFRPDGEDDELLRQWIQDKLDNGYQIEKLNITNVRNAYNHIQMVCILSSEEERCKLNLSGALL